MLKFVECSVYAQASIMNKISHQEDKQYSINYLSSNPRQQSVSEMKRRAGLDGAGVCFRINKPLLFLFSCLFSCCFTTEQTIATFL